MDFSKLPKLSDTRSQSPPPVEVESTDVQPPAETLGYARGYTSSRPGVRQPGVGADIWISVVIGILLLMMGRDFGRFAIAKMSGHAFHTGVIWQDDTPQAGQEENYFDLAGFTALSDMGIFLFGLMLLFEAAAKASTLALRPGLLPVLILSIALLLTVLATLINIYACIKLFGFGITPITSGLAVAFGGWISYDEFKTIQNINDHRKIDLVVQG